MAIVVQKCGGSSPPPASGSALLLEEAKVEDAVRRLHRCMVGDA